MRVLVTGGTGYLGQAVVRALDAAGHHAVVYGRSASTSSLPGTLVDGDIRDGVRLSASASGCDAILHAAALVALWRRRPRDFDEVNVDGLSRVLDTARALGIPRIVYTSSFLALPPAGSTAPGIWNDYQRTKVAADALATSAVEDGAPLIRLYPGVIYGPGRLTDGNLVGRQIADHLAGRLHGLVGASRTWSFAFVDDVSAAHVAALERGTIGARYHLGGDNAPQMRIFEIVRALTGRRLPRCVPDWAASLVALAYDARASALGMPPLLTRGTLEILRHDWPLDSALAERDLGYRRASLEDGVRSTVESLMREATHLQPPASSLEPLPPTSSLESPASSHRSARA